uniref:Secreted protein n=1 Tax=Musa acuminata subsp. malaccensis TaxID=214687 RepID=A0A804IQ61_MUSAM
MVAGWAASGVVAGWAAAATVVATGVSSSKRTGDCFAAARGLQPMRCPVSVTKGQSKGEWQRSFSPEPRGSGGWEASGGHLTVAGSGGGLARRRQHSRCGYDRRGAAATEEALFLQLLQRGATATGGCGCDPRGGLSSRCSMTSSSIGSIIR